MTLLTTSMTIPWMMWFFSLFISCWMLAECGVVFCKGVNIQLWTSALQLRINSPVWCYQFSFIPDSIQVFQSWYLHNIFIWHRPGWSFWWKDWVKIIIVIIVSLCLIRVCYIHHLHLFSHIVIVLLCCVISALILICCAFHSFSFRFGWLLKVFINHPLHKFLQCALGLMVYMLH